MLSLSYHVSIINHQPHQPSTSSTINHQPSSINYQSSSINHQPSTITINHQPSTTNHQPPTTNHQPPTTNHQPPTTDHQPSTSSTINLINFINCQPSTINIPQQPHQPSAPRATCTRRVAASTRATSCWGCTTAGGDSSPQISTWASPSTPWLILYICTYKCSCRPLKVNVWWVWLLKILCSVLIFNNRCWTEILRLLLCAPPIRTEHCCQKQRLLGWCLARHNGIRTNTIHNARLFLVHWTVLFPRALSISDLSNRHV